MKVFRADMVWQVNDETFKGEVTEFQEASDFNLIVDKLREVFVNDHSSKGRGPIVTIKVIEDEERHAKAPTSDR